MVVYEKGNETYRDAFLAGTVVSVQKKKTKETGNNILFVTINSKVYDDELEEFLAEDNEIVFLDNPDGEFGPEEYASRAEKKLKKNRKVIIRTSEKVSVNEDGIEERQFYGRSVDFTGKHMKTKKTDRGPASDIIIGYVVPNKSDEDDSLSISVPINFYDKTGNENYTVFANLKADNMEDLYNKYKYDKDAGEKCKVACFVIDDYKEEKDKTTKRITSIEGTILSDKEILFGDNVE